MTTHHRDAGVACATPAPTGCPGGHAPHDEECGLDAFIVERRRIRAESARRDREFAEREAWFRYWRSEILGGAA